MSARPHSPRPQLAILEVQTNDDGGVTPPGEIVFYIGTKWRELDPEISDFVDSHLPEPVPGHPRCDIAEPLEPFQVGDRDLD